jgi:2-polyprenyl-3-methyl-5-hydroxy-6-metoxy-1,4-benzoquinol methylase
MTDTAAAEVEPLRRLERRHNELGERFPRCALVALGEAERLDELAAMLERLPPALALLCAEVAVLLHGSELDSAVPEKLAAIAARLPNLRVHRDPRSYGHGGRRKIAFEYALQQGFDFVVAFEPEGVAVERLAELLAPALLDEKPLVIARDPARGGACAALHDAVLGLGLRDYASPLRVYACEALRRVPFHLNDDGRGFDTELLIQFRALGVECTEIDLPSPSRGFSCAASLRIALGYRLHQLHFTRRGQYFVDHDVHYTLKHSPSSSHMQVLDAIRPGSLVLDLGCSQGLLAAPLAKKGVRVVGVDARDPKTVSIALAAFYQRNLEEPLELPEARVFDYVVVSDVIEHVVNRVELLRSVRRYLKPEGRLLISTPNIAIWFYRLSLLLGRFEYGPRGVLDETHVHLFTRATFRREVENAAFRILRERVTALPFEVVFESTGRSRSVRALSATYHAAARLWPEMFAYQFLLEAEVATLLDEPAKR